MRYNLLKVYLMICASGNLRLHTLNIFMLCRTIKVRESSFTLIRSGLVIKSLEIVLAGGEDI